jgi:hypothetical protein
MGGYFEGGVYCAWVKEGLAKILLDISSLS